MNLTKYNISIFFIAILLGILISSNKANINAIILELNSSTENYYSIAQRKLNLQNEINLLTQEYKDNYTKLELYKNTSQRTNVVQNELNNYRTILGNSVSSGAGVRIVLKDGQKDFNQTDDNFKDWARLIHDFDILKILNELRISGAQAITVNGIRFTGTSSLICSGPFVDIDGIKSPAPYIIEAIGNPDSIYLYIDSNEGYFKYLKNARRTTVSIEKDFSIKMPASIKSTDPNFLSEVYNK
jgi:uncharacterized protein YlxW (UPF0749 family)